MQTNGKYLTKYISQLKDKNIIVTGANADEMARFAEKGRYLSLKYLEGIGDKPTKTFNNYSTKSIGETINELSEEKVQDLRGRIERIHRMEEEFLSSRLGQGGRETGEGSIQRLLESNEPERRVDTQLVSAPLFDYAEWKNNDVAFGEQPKLVYQSNNVLATADEPVVITDAVGEITKSTDTRDGSDIWLVNPADRVSKEEFNPIG